MTARTTVCRWVPALLTDFLQLVGVIYTVVSTTLIELSWNKPFDKTKKKKNRKVNKKQLFNQGTLTTNREPAEVPVVGLQGCWLTVLFLDRTASLPSWCSSASHEGTEAVRSKNKNVNKKNRNKNNSRFFRSPVSCLTGVIDARRGSTYSFFIVSRP